MLIDGGSLTLFSLISFLVYLLGIINAAHAVMRVRSSRGAIAWSISLVTFPWLAVPLYWVFSKDHFQGYAETLRAAYLKHRELVHRVDAELNQHQASLPPELSALQTLAKTFSTVPFTAGNALDLLIDGEQTFAAMLNAIATAKGYVLLQTYIIHEDDIGNQFRHLLIEKAKQGVRVYLLFDGLGSNKLPRQYVRSLQQVGIQVSAFKSTKGKGNRFQLNFRNHRKILVVDGETAFVGGFNIGDEYLGRDRRLSPWRDTHLRLQGAAVQCLQRVFLSDWYWATRDLLTVQWQVQPALDRNETAYIFPTGPADPLPICTLFFTHLINEAQERLWIASPYFVPDDAVLTALKLAATRGVDVRILLPNRADHLFVYWCSFSYYAEMHAAGVKLYRYQKGFMHQKVILSDRQLAGVGTVNLDNRSFYLNFEVMSFSTSLQFIERVEHMLRHDFEVCRRVQVGEYSQRSIAFKLAVKISRLLTPIL